MRIQTSKQRAASERNFNIKRLRGIAANARGIPMSKPAQDYILMGVDLALLGLGADTEAKHKEKVLERFQETIEKPIPF